MLKKIISFEQKHKLFALLGIHLLLMPVYLFCFGFAFCLACLPLFNSRTAHANLKEHLNASLFKRLILIAQIYIGYLFYFIEALLLQPLRLTIYSVNADNNIEHLLETTRALYPEARQRGFVFILPHMANVEIASNSIIAYMQKHKRLSLFALAKPTRFTTINKLLQKYRFRFGVKVIWTNKNLLRNMEAAIKVRGSFCLLVDQKPKQNGVFIRFFGQYAAFPTAGLKYCMNHNMIVIYAAAHRILPGWIHVEMRNGKNPHLAPCKQSQEKHIETQSLMGNETYCKNEPPIKEEVHVNLEMACFANWLEEKIRLHPTQWCWDYRKWSRKPNSI